MKIVLFLFLTMIATLPAVEPPWAVHVYMVQGDMVPEAKKDFAELVAAAGQVPIVIQWVDDALRIRRATLTGNETWNAGGDLLPAEISPCDASTVTSFLQWAMAQAPSQRRILVFWGHGNFHLGIGSMQDGPGGSRNDLSYEEIAAGATAAGYPQTSWWAAAARA